MLWHVMLRLISLIEGQSMSPKIGGQPGNTNNPTVCLVTQLALDYKLTCPNRHFFLTFYMDAKESNSASHAYTC